MACAKGVITAKASGTSIEALMGGWRLLRGVVVPQGIAE